MKISSVSRPHKTKAVVIREEYVAITKRFEQALILNQFVYWTVRVHDFDRFTEEENARKNSHGMEEDTQELNHGWFYKKASTLSKELMTKWSDNTTRKHLKALIRAGYIEERLNPRYKWDQTKQYRVNLNKIEEDLFKHGYSIPGFSVTKEAVAESEIANSNAGGSVANSEIQRSENEIQPSKTEIVPLTETTLESIKETTTDAEPIENSSTPEQSPQDVVVENTKQAEPTNEKINENLNGGKKGNINAVLEKIRPAFMSNSIQELIQRSLKNHTEQYVIDAIVYSNKGSKKGNKGAYHKYLKGAIKGNWADTVTNSINTSHVCVQTPKSCVTEIQTKLRNMRAAKTDQRDPKAAGERFRAARAQRKNRLNKLSINV